MSTTSMRAQNMRPKKLYYKVEKLQAHTDITTVDEGGRRIKIKAGEEVATDRSCQAWVGGQQVSAQIREVDFDDAVKQGALRRITVELQAE